MVNEAEKIASKMIYEDRMRGSIDQVEAVIHFVDDTEELQQWDQQSIEDQVFGEDTEHLFQPIKQLCFMIVGICQALNDILDRMAKNRMAKKGFQIPV